MYWENCIHVNYVLGYNFMVGLPVYSIIQFIRDRYEYIMELLTLYGTVV